ncbi:MAG: hypothetical protein PUK42_07200 [Prevotellaceae bacterium]|nr:hypothetical protein [Prevotellaceae bacterium]MDY5947254.1 hypothetical protein [Prevotella sp.]
MTTIGRHSDVAHEAESWHEEHPERRTIATSTLFPITRTTFPSY